jgi:drug/metabolite transporter (DMT)-like permease
MLGVLLVATAAASWGTWSLFLRPTGLPSTITSPIVFVVMGLATLPLALRGPRMRWDRTTVKLLVANTLLDALNVVTFFGALRYTTVAIAVLTHYLAPILIALAAPRVDGTVTRGARSAAVVALSGLLVLLEPWHAPAAGVVAGGALGLASAVCYAGNVFVVRRLAERIGSARAVSYHSLLAAVILLPFGVSGFGAVTACDLCLLAAGAITIGAASGVMFVDGLGRIGSARAAVLTFAEPLVAVAVGMIAWHEPLRPLAAAGGGLVLAAGVQVARQPARPRSG